MNDVASATYSNSTSVVINIENIVSYYINDK